MEIFNNLGCETMTALLLAGNVCCEVFSTSKYCSYHKSERVVSVNEETKENQKKREIQILKQGAHHLFSHE